MKTVMNKKRVPTLDNLIQQSRNFNVRFVAGQMSMNVRGGHVDELIDGIEQGGIGTYISDADDAGLNLFV